MWCLIGPSLRIICLNPEALSAKFEINKQSGHCSNQASSASKLVMSASDWQVNHIQVLIRPLGSLPVQSSIIFVIVQQRTFAWWSRADLLIVCLCILINLSISAICISFLVIGVNSRQHVLLLVLSLFHT